MKKYVVEVFDQGQSIWLDTPRHTYWIELKDGDFKTLERFDRGPSGDGRRLFQMTPEEGIVKDTYDY